MKTKLRMLILTVAGCLCFSIFAELPQHVKVSDGTSEHWYFIQNGINHKETGTAAHRNGMYVTTFGGEATSTQVRGHHMLLSGNRDYQLWQLVESADSTGYYYLINKATGNALSLGTGVAIGGASGEDGLLAPNIGNRYYTVENAYDIFDIDLCRTALKGTKVSDKYVSIRRAKVGEFNAKLLGGFGQVSRLSVFDHNANYFTAKATMTSPMESPRSWALIPEEEAIARYPITSTDTESHWYNIKSAFTDANFNGKLITATTDGSAANLNAATVTHEDNNQLWKFLKVNSSDFCDSVYVMSKSGMYLDGKGKMTTSPVGLIMQHLFADDNQFRFLPYNAGAKAEQNSRSIYANANYEITEATAANNYVYGSAAAFYVIFKNTTTDTGTTVSKTDSEALRISVEDGKIQIKGSVKRAEVFSASGAKCNPTQRFEKGVYVVKVGEITRKVIVH